MDRVVMVLDLTHVYNFHCWIGENFAIFGVDGNWIKAYW